MNHVNILINKPNSEMNLSELSKNDGKRNTRKSVVEPERNTNLAYTYMKTSAKEIMTVIQETMFLQTAFNEDWFKLMRILKMIFILANNFPISKFGRWESPICVEIFYITFQFLIELDINKNNLEKEVICANVAILSSPAILMNCFRKFVNFSSPVRRTIKLTLTYSLILF